MSNHPASQQGFVAGAELTVVNGFYFNWIQVKIFWGKQSVWCLIELSVIKCKGKSSNVYLIVAAFGE